MPSLTIIRDISSPVERELPFEPGTVVLFPYKLASEFANEKIIKNKGIVFGLRYTSLFSLLLEFSKRASLKFTVPKESYRRFLLLKMLEQSDSFRRSAGYFVDEFAKLDEILPDKIITHSELKPYQKEAFEIIKRFRLRLREEGFIREDELYLLVAESLNETIVGSIFPFRKKLILRGFLELTESERQFVFSLSRYFDETYIEIEREPEHRFVQLYIPMITLENSIKRGFLGEVKVIERRAKDERVNTLLSALCYPEKKLKPPFRIVALKDRFDEVAFVLSEIKRNMDDGCEFGDFLVLVHQIDTYAPIFELLADSFGLPLKLMGYGSLLSKPLVKTIIRLIMAARDGLTFSDLEWSLSQPYLKFLTKPHIKELQALSEFSTIALTNEQLLIKKLEKSPSDELQNVFNFIHELNSILERISRYSSVSEFCDNLINIVKDFSLDKEDDEKIREVFISLVDDIKVIARLLGKDYLEFSDITYIIKELCSEKRVGNVSSGIAVCRPEEGAFIGAKYLFFIGFVDGEFPPLEHENNILTDKELNNLGVRKPNSKFRHIHSFIRNISRKDAVITVTYPNYDGEIKKIPSVFVFPFVDASEKLRPALDNAHFGYQIALGKRCSEIYVSGNRIKEDKIVVPEHIKHSIETQFVRYFRPAINNYTGVISKEVLEDPTVRMAIYSEKLSVTGIERYIECPFRFFVENILKLNRIMVPAPELTPLSFGALIHKILKEFYLRRLKKIYGCSMPNLSEIDDYEHLLKGVSIKKENIAEVRDELSSIVDEIIDEEISHSFHHLVGFYKKRLKTILGAFLELEMKTNRGLPFLVEAGFGSSRGYAFSISDKPYPIGSNIVISGVIDRLELVNNKKIILVDYKTGEPPSKTDILRGVKIQLPLYALAIKNILSGTKLELAGLAVYSFSPKRVEVKRGPVIGEFERGERTDLDELIAMTEEIVMTVSQKIVAGEFHYNFDDESNCRNCDLNHICKLEYLEYPLSFNFEDKSSNTIPVKELVKIIERM